MVAYKPLKTFLFCAIQDEDQPVLCITLHIKMWLTTQFLKYQQNRSYFNNTSKNKRRISKILSTFFPWKEFFCFLNQMHSTVGSESMASGRVKHSGRFISFSLSGTCSLCLIERGTTEGPAPTSSAQLPAREASLLPGQLSCDHVCGCDYLVILMRVQYFNSLF